MSSSSKNSSSKERNGKTGPLQVTMTSFGYKEGAPPAANMVFDVRFLKNPYWVEELRPLSGRDAAVQQYVFEQPLAEEFLKSLLHMLDALLPKLQELSIPDFSIAFGCTGGRHRSATMVEVTASRLIERYPEFKIAICHRELDGNSLEGQPVHCRPGTAQAQGRDLA